MACAGMARRRWRVPLDNERRPRQIVQRAAATRKTLSNAGDSIFSDDRSARNEKRETRKEKEIKNTAASSTPRV